MSTDLHPAPLVYEASWSQRLFSRSHVLAWAGIGVLIALGWIYLTVMVVDMISVMDMTDAGAGMSVFNAFAQWADLGALGLEVLRSICRIDTVTQFSGVSAGSVISTFGYVFVMWVAMSFAMMLPTAAPMITTYAEIAETARARKIDVVSPLVLIAGYMSVWASFAVLATIAQLVLIQMSQITEGLVLKSPYLGAGVLAVAGLYQFTSFKTACLTKCRTPFPFFMANWSDKVSGVFRMGVRQGVVCVLCCWALMLVMFAAGLMNVFWIIVLSVIMLAEKVLPRPMLVVRISGGLFLIWAVGLLTAAV